MYKVEAEPDAGWVRRLVALAAVEQHLREAELVLVHISCSCISEDFAGSVISYYLNSVYR